MQDSAALGICESSTIQEGINIVNVRVKVDYLNRGKRLTFGVIACLASEFLSSMLAGDRPGKADLGTIVYWFLKMLGLSIKCNLKIYYLSLLIGFCSSRQNELPYSSTSSTGLLDCSQNSGERRTRTGSEAAMEPYSSSHQSTSHKLSEYQINLVYSQLKSESKVSDLPNLGYVCVLCPGKGGGPWLIAS